MNDITEEFDPKKYNQFLTNLGTIFNSRINTQYWIIKKIDQFLNESDHNYNKPINIRPTKKYPKDVLEYELREIKSANQAINFHEGNNNAFIVTVNKTHYNLYLHELKLLLLIIYMTFIKCYENTSNPNLFSDKKMIAKNFEILIKYDSTILKVQNLIQENIANSLKYLQNNSIILTYTQIKDDTYNISYKPLIIINAIDQMNNIYEEIYDDNFIPRPFDSALFDKQIYLSEKEFPEIKKENGILSINFRKNSQKWLKVGRIKTKHVMLLDYLISRNEYRKKEFTLNAKVIYEYIYKETIDEFGNPIDKSKLDDLRMLAKELRRKRGNIDPITKDLCKIKINNINKTVTISIMI